MSLLLSLLIGAIIGLSSGMFGIGGALLGTPLLKLWLGLSPMLALATPLPAAIPGALSGTIGYARKGLVRYAVAWRVLIVAAPLGALGAWVTKFTPPIVLMVATGVLLVYSASTFIRRGWGRRGKDADIAEEIPLGMPAYLAGALAGFLSGFLAIGGGMILVPAFVKIVKMPIKQAVATSLFCVAVLAIPGVLVHWALGHIEWPVSLVLSIAVIPMSYLGARLAISLKSSTLEKSYGVMMLLFAIYFIARSLAG